MIQEKPEVWFHSRTSQIRQAPGRAQMESAIVYGLTAAMYSEVIIENGTAKESNFYQYAMMRHHE